MNYFFWFQGPHVWILVYSSIPPLLLVSSFFLTHPRCLCRHPSLLEQVSARLWHYTGDGLPFVNHLTVFPLVEPNVEDETLQITHYLGVMRYLRPTSD